MADTEDREIKHKATSGLGWKRLEDGNYLWQPHRWAQARILSDETFKAVGSVRSFEIAFAAITLMPIAPMTVFALEGRMHLTTFVTILLCLIVPNVVVNRYATRRLRSLTQDAELAKNPPPSFPLNPLRTMPDRFLNVAKILLSIYCAAILFGFISLISDTGLPPPPANFNVYSGTGLLILFAFLLYAVVQERRRRKRRQ